MSRWRRLVCRLIGHRWQRSTIRGVTRDFPIRACARCRQLVSLTPRVWFYQPTRPALFDHSRLGNETLDGWHFDQAPRAGTAAPAPPAPTDIPAASTPQPDRDSGSDIGEGDQSSFTWDGGPYGSLSLTGARVRTGSSTSTRTPFDDWRRSRSDSSGSR